MYVPPAVTLKSFNGKASEFDRYVVRVPTGKTPVLILLFLELREFLVANMGIITSNWFSPAL
jgi:hypothetical protein